MDLDGSDLGKATAAVARPLSAARLKAFTATESKKPSNLSVLKDRIEIVQKLVAIVGIAVAAVWFVVSGEPVTKLDTVVTIEDHAFADKPWTLIMVKVGLENVGRRTITINHASADLRQVFPLAASVLKKFNDQDLAFTDNGLEIQWPRVQKVESSRFLARLEPGERDSIGFEFLVPRELQTVKVQTDIAEDSWRSALFGRDLFWRSSAVYVIKSNRS
jgi:hypothetical protein